MFEFDTEPESEPRRSRWFWASLSGAFVAMVVLTMAAIVMGSVALYWIVRVTQA
jgi:hypothetical protein